jgi:hypothetical protein
MLSSMIICIENIMLKVLMLKGSNMMRSRGDLGDDEINEDNGA